ncbi:hypothetical protein [Gloeothece verrucosa]|uniref:DUF4276 domain-containing protein n=1 Tax=Gloeothece verrucosa (strain PCC 7822) TaxID=497965 RepID=E0UBB7_GLOV7|nr:hypothetical protein [Gloeothece verrucosa]ADN17473.1 conserved hypothetical protein [Gloeothece verrucosa PCC 7822]
MNIYFLVEGKSTEKKIYPAWLKYFIPELKQVEFYDQVDKNNYFIISGKGYPSILYDGIPNAVQKIKKVGKYNYFVICIDADEDTVTQRKQDVFDFIESEKIKLDNTQIEVIIQNRCIETWLLGNRRIFNSRQPLEKPLLDYVNYYDVCRNDPELMGKYNIVNHATFHFKYLQQIFRCKNKNISYTKKFPCEAQKEHYFKQLLNRIRDEPEHLQTFRSFIKFCEKIKQQIST